jgi:hypothetical protein
MATTLAQQQAGSRRRASKSALPAWLAVLALHGLLFSLIARPGAWRERGPVPPSPPPLMFWLLDRTPPPAATAEAQAVPPPRARRPPSAPQRVQAPSTQPAEPQAITQPAVEAPNATAAPSPQTEPSSASPAPLNLSLPRGASAAWRQRNPALDDARANSRAPRTLATLVEQALGGDPSGPITEEALADGSVRFRRGSQCVIARPNQAQNLDPFNGSVLPKPRLIDRC